MSESIIDIKGLKNCFSGQWVHKDVNLEVYQGEILAIIGGSGSGKTTILRSLLMLQKPTAGIIHLFGEDISKLDYEQTTKLRQRFGMMFQHSALFSGMSVLENVMFPMRAFASISKSMMTELAMLKIALVGLPKDAAHKFPAQLSGGMQRRAAAARAIAMDPELLFLDEPTTGLDPRGARQFDDLLLFLRDALKLTIVMISHDIESLKRATDRVAFVGDGRILAAETIDKLMHNPEPAIADYFRNV